MFNSKCHVLSTRPLAAIIVAGFTLHGGTVSASTYNAIPSARFFERERELCLDLKAEPMEMHLRLPVPPGMARNNDRASSRSRSLYTHPTDPLNFVEYGTSVRLAKACCLNQAVTPTARPDATYMLLDQLGPGLPYVSFSKSKIAPVAQEGVFHTTVALQYLKVEPTDCTVDAWASDGLESGFGSFLQGSGAAGVGAGAAGVGNFGGSGGGGVGGGGGLVSAGPSRRSGSGGVIPPLLLLPDVPNTTDIQPGDPTEELPELRTELLPPQEDLRGVEPSSPPLAVPGPIAGAGVPTLLLWSILSWARRRKVAASAS
jgi:hypothetical protein